MDLKQEILRRMEALPVELQRRILEYVSGNMAAPTGASGEELSAFARTLPPGSAREMIEAIESECERIDAAQW